MELRLSGILPRLTAGFYLVNAQVSRQKNRAIQANVEDGPSLFILVPLHRAGRCAAWGPRVVPSRLREPPARRKHHRLTSAYQ